MRLRDEKTLSRMLGVFDEPGFADYREQALQKLQANEASIIRLLFRTRTEVDASEIEYFRGFRQGVMYMLDGLPNQLRAEYERLLKKESGR